MTFKALPKVMFNARQVAKMEAVVSSGNVNNSSFESAGEYIVVGVNLRGSVCPPYADD